tara:strand:+ start:116 stop:445 length:330 start_codon:yes stop_codon:yes gene_type:complete
VAMAAKKLEDDSNYNKYDLDGDGVVSDTELDKITKLEEMELKEEKADAQRRMAWVSIIVMILFTTIIMIPGLIPETRLKLLGDLSSLFYISMAGIVGAYMGMTAYMSKK